MESDVKSPIGQTGNGRGLFPAVKFFPTLPMEQIRGNLRKLHIRECDIRVFLGDTDFSSLPYKSHQVCFVQQYFCETVGSEITMNDLAMVFELNVKTVRKYLLRGSQEPTEPGRHRALDEKFELDVTTMILQVFVEGNAMTKRQVVEFIREKYDRSLTKGWLHAFIGRNLDTLQICHSLPQEDTSLTVLREQLEDHIENMKSVVAGKFAELVFNLNEVRSSDWDDLKPRKDIELRTVSQDNDYHSVSRWYR
jgi:hypothetical protein